MLAVYLPCKSYHCSDIREKNPQVVFDRFRMKKPPKIDWEIEIPQVNDIQWTTTKIEHGQISSAFWSRSWTREISSEPVPQPVTGAERWSLQSQQASAWWNSQETDPYYGCFLKWWYHYNFLVSTNGGAPKWLVYNGKSYLNGWFGGTPISGNHHIVNNSKYSKLRQESVKSHDGAPNRVQDSKFNFRKWLRQVYVCLAIRKSHNCMVGFDLPVLYWASA